MLLFYCVIFVILALSDIALGQCPLENAASRIDCGYPGITWRECVTARGCCWDHVTPPPTKWCFNKTEDREGTRRAVFPLLPSNRRTQNEFSYRRTTAAIQYAGQCLFHCTSIERTERVPRSRDFTNERSCLAAGCCYDSSDYVINRRCYYPAADGQSCPRAECLVTSGVMRKCAADGLRASVCESLGCCSYKTSQTRICYFSEDPPRLHGTLRNASSSFSSDENQASNQQISATLISTTTSTTTPAATTRRLSFIETLKRENGGTLRGFSVIDLLTKSLSRFNRDRNNADSSHNRDSPAIILTTTTAATTTTTTTIATTARTTTPTTTTPPPMTRRVCSWGRCRMVPIPTSPPPFCFPRECGQPRFYPGATIPPPVNSLKKIVGGTRAYPFSHPWTVMILKKEGSRTFMCGAAVICEHWLITAAHCFNRQTSRTPIPDLDAIFYKIYVGRYVGWREKHGTQVQVFDGRKDIDFMEQHENFTIGISRGVITYDIGIIRLKREIQFNQYVQPVCMPTEKARRNQIIWATGWGLTKNRGPNASRMKQLGIRVLNESVCEQKVPGYSEKRPTGVLCAGDERYQDTCTGDSGGPVVGPKFIGYDRERKRIQRWMLYGLTSIGSPSCNTLLFDKQPALYTDVHYYMAWIKSKTNNCCS